MMKRYQSEQKNIAAVVNKLYSVSPGKWNRSGIGGDERDLYKFDTKIDNTTYSVYIRFGGIYKIGEHRCAVFGDVLSPASSREEYTTGFSISPPGEKPSVWEDGMYTHDESLCLTDDNSKNIKKLYSKLNKPYVQEEIERERTQRELEEKRELDIIEERRTRGSNAIKQSLKSLK